MFKTIFILLSFLCSLDVAKTEVTYTDTHLVAVEAYGNTYGCYCEDTELQVGDEVYALFSVSANPVETRLLGIKGPCFRAG